MWQAFSLFSPACQTLALVQVMRDNACQDAQKALPASEQYMQPGPCTLAPVFRDFSVSADEPAGCVPSDATGHGPCRELFRLCGQNILQGVPGLGDLSAPAVIHQAARPCTL